MTATNPDVFCFLESKTNAEKMFAMKGFEEWLASSGFSHVFCHWSMIEGNKSHGNEGIIILSKVKPVRVKYGMGVQDFDLQARVVTRVPRLDWHLHVQSTRRIHRVVLELS